MPIVFASFKHLELPISNKMPVTILHLFIFVWQLYLRIWALELQVPIC